MNDMQGLQEVRQLSPREVRRLIRAGQFTKDTTGLAMGYIQGNLAILPEKYALDFAAFFQKETIARTRTFKFFAQAFFGTVISRRYEICRAFHRNLKVFDFTEVAFQSIGCLFDSLVHHVDICRTTGGASHGISPGI